MPTASCCFLHIFHFWSLRYQRKSNLSKTFWIFFLDQKKTNKHWKKAGGHMRAPQANPTLLGGPATSWACVGFPLKRKGWCSKVDKYFPQFVENQGINPIGGKSKAALLAPTQTIKHLHPMLKRGCQSLRGYLQGWDLIEIEKRLLELKVKQN